MSAGNGYQFIDGPVTKFIRLSGSSASAPGILITATTPTGGGTLVHTGDTNATDMLYVYVYNNTAGAITAYGQAGTTASTGAMPVSVAATSYSLIAPGVPIGGGGAYGIWSTSTTGLMAIGYVARTFAT